jgi:transposase
MTDITDYAALIGLDWGDQAHALALQDQALTSTEKSTIPHSAESLQDWINALRTRFGGRPVAIALEAKHAPVVHALMQVEFITLYPVNPKTSACYRQAFNPSGAKDDIPDADLLLDLLRVHRDQLTPWHPDDVPTRKLDGLVQARRAAVDLRTQLSNSLTTLLKGYFPQAFELVGEDLFSPMACAFLLKWSDLISLKAARPNSVRAFFQAHNVRRPQTVQKRLERIASAKPLTTDDAIVSVSVLSTRLLAGQLQKLAQSIKLYDQQIQQVFADHSEAHLFRHLPGAGPALAPRLLVAFGTQRDRFPLAANLQRLSGIAPVTEKSGNHKWVHWRWSAPRFLRQSLVEWANQSIQYSSWAAAYYARQKNRGKPHQAIIRALAFKWIRILWKCWKDNVPYDEARYLKHLATKNSPLVKLTCEKSN